MPIESHLEEFVAIVEQGSVAAAARALGVPRASLSRRLARLEASYGVTLVHRETHRHTLTQAGRALYQRARKIVGDLAEARQAVSRLDDVPRGVLRVGLPEAAGLEVPLASAFIARYPEVQLEFIGAQSHRDLLGSGLDVALQVGEVPDLNLIGRTLITFRRLVYAAPSLIARLGPPTLDRLATYPCLLGFESDGQPETHWPLWSGGRTPVQGPLRTTNLNSCIEGARRGLGLTLTSERAARPWVESGALVPVLEDEVGAQTTVRLVWPATDYLEPKVRAFVDLACEVIGAMVRARDAASD